MPPLPTPLEPRACAMLGPGTCFPNALAHTELDGLPSPSSSQEAPLCFWGASPPTASLQPPCSPPSPSLLSQFPLSPRKMLPIPERLRGTGSPHGEAGVTQGMHPSSWAGEQGQGHGASWGRGGPLIFLTSNEFPPHPQGRAVGSAQGRGGGRDEVAKHKGGCSGDRVPAPGELILPSQRSPAQRQRSTA